METEQASTIAPYQRCLRIVGIGIPVASVLCPGLVFSGIGGSQGGRLWAPIITVAPALALGWLGWGRARGRVAANAVVAILGLALGGWIAQVSSFSHGRLRAEMDSVSVPAGYEWVADEKGGWSVCFDECSFLARRWRSPGDAEQIRSTVTELLESQGFILGSWRAHGQGNDMDGGGHRGRLGAHVTVADWMFQGRAPDVAPGRSGPRYAGAGYLLRGPLVDLLQPRTQRGGNSQPGVRGRRLAVS